VLVGPKVLIGQIENRHCKLCICAGWVEAGEPNQPLRLNPGFAP